ncbi:Os09g0555850, partial [Oryza sativa Japonica Group]
AARHVAQRELLHLPRGVLGELVDEHHLPRHHVVRHPVPAEGHHLLLAHLAGAGELPLQRHERARRLAPVRVRHGHHRRLPHRRVLVQRRLHLHAADVLAAGDDHVLGPVLDLHVPVRVDDAHVAGEEPPVPERVRRGARVLEVSLHDVAAAEHDLAHGGAVAGHALHRLEVLHVGVGEGERAHALPRLEPRALRRWQGVPLLPPLAHHHHAGGLRHAVGVRDVEAEPLDALEQRRGRRRAAGEHLHGAAQRLPARAVEEDVEEHRRGAHVGDAVRGERRVHGVGGRRADADVRAAARRHAPGEGPAVAVEHRERPQVDRLVADAPLEKKAHGVEVRAAVAVHDALGRRRRAGGVVERDGVPLVLHRPRRVPRRVSPRHQLLVLELADAGARRLVGVVDDDEQRQGRPDLAAVAVAVAHDGLERVGGDADELVVDEEHLGLGVPDDGGDVGRVEAGVDGVQHRSGHRHGEVHLVQRRRVGRDDGHL